jgi:S-DNA-T family DNA segregation ATPase FtsK/SpoIIIE
MLFSSSWDPVLQRIQGSFLSEDEVERVVGFVKKNGEPDYLDDEYFADDEEDDQGFELESDDGIDPLMDEALKIVYLRKSASASYLQRRLKIGYNRAARIIEEMEDRGIIGPARGSQPREVLRVTDLD